MLIRKPNIRLLPAVCDVSVTDACNAACDFCGFTRDKRAGQNRHWIDRNALARGLPLLSRRRIKYLGIQGGEPLSNPEVDRIIADAVEIGMRVALVTNGWLLPSKIDAIADAGLRTLTVWLDSADVVTHEKNRGLSGLTAPDPARLGAGLALSNLPHRFNYCQPPARVRRIAGNAESSRISGRYLLLPAQ